MCSSRFHSTRCSEIFTVCSPPQKLNLAKFSCIMVVFYVSHIQTCITFVVTFMYGSKITATYEKICVKHRPTLNFFYFCLLECLVYLFWCLDYLFWCLDYLVWCLHYRLWCLDYLFWCLEYLFWCLDRLFYCLSRLFCYLESLFGCRNSVLDF